MVYLASPCSDHIPLSIKIGHEEQNQQRQKCKQYVIFWERAVDLPGIISSAWASAGPKHNLGEIYECMTKVMGVLQGWSRRKFGNVLRELDKLRKELALLQQNNGDPREIRHLIDIMNALQGRNVTDPKVTDQFAPRRGP